MRILIVEHSAVIRERLRDMLQKIPNIELAGEADNVGDAVLNIRKIRPDVVILDYVSDRGNNLSLMYWIKLQSLDTRVIVLTNNVYSQYRKNCMEAGADYFMDKSRDIDELGRLLSTLAAASAIEPGTIQDEQESLARSK